ncbi:hypothetical protein C8D03_0151 [Bosea sp. 124]|nr:hypothetical protein C8D03_0151 [Bosea sp. 124]
MYTGFAVRRLPPSVQTLYADLVQKVSPDAPVPGSISIRMVHNVERYYSTERHGAKRIQRYLGPVHDPAIVAMAEAIRREEAIAKQRRKNITMLKSAGVQGPSQEVGRILEVMSRADLFERGMVLVGTIAFQTYPILLGYDLSASGMMTQDVDFVAANVRVSIGGRANADAEEPGDRTAPKSLDMLTLLKRADDSFVGVPNLGRKTYPNKFTATNGLDVELLTPVRKRDEDNPVALPAWGASAVPLHYLEYLVQDAMPAVALHGAGVPILVPQPARYAVHKLIVAQLRDAHSGKAGKDRVQAKALMDVLDESDPDTVADALDDAISRGLAWRKHVNAGLRQIGRNARVDG